MPKHGEHVVSFADVESVKVHKKKARDQAGSMVSL
jgi:hypothetical protein